MERIRSLTLKKKILLLFVLAVLAVIVKVGIIIYNTPPLDIENLKYNLSQNSKIVGDNGEIIGELISSEFRSSIPVEDLPPYVKQAFVAIEDKRFYSHKGIDFMGIASATLDNIKARGLVRGASTITQQLIKNTHLSNEKTIDRKVKEAYLSFQLERHLEKDKILEAYLNTNFFGQNSYGIEAASKVYFSKSAKDLSVDEAAILAAIIQNPGRFSPYKKVAKKDVDFNKDTVLGEVMVAGNQYTCVYSPAFEERRDLIIKEMYKQKKITKEQFDEAINTDPMSSIKPSGNTTDEQLYYLSDFVKNEAVEILKNNNDYSDEKARYMVESSGYTIKTSINMDMQEKLNKIYSSKGNIRELMTTMDYKIDPSTGNLVDSKGEILYYDKDNIIDKGWFYFDSHEYKIRDGGIEIKSDKIESNANNIFYKDYFSISDKGDLIIYNIDNTPFENGELVKTDDFIFITKEYLSNKPDFFTNDGKKLRINSDFYNIDTIGKKQPDVSSMILDPKTNMVSAVYGGRNAYMGYSSNNIYEQKLPPYNLVKPFTLFYPRLITNNTAINKDRVKSEFNQYSTDLYKEIMEQNPDAFKTSLETFEIINPDQPEKDSFITKDENAANNDEGRDSLAYGRFKNGLSLYDLSKAYTHLSAAENSEVGVITDILDRDGKVLYNNKDRKKIDVDHSSKFLTKYALSENEFNYKVHSNINNKRHAITIQGSNDIVLASMITNNHSKITFTGDTSNQVLNRELEAAFKEDLNKSPFQAPKDVHKYNVCNISGQKANDSCIETNSYRTIYTMNKIDNVCDTKHKRNKKRN